MASMIERRRKLTNGEVHALNASAFAADEFEPFVGSIIHSRVLKKVVQNGLVETGPSCRPAVGNIGYRLTAAGWIQFNRSVRERRARQSKATKPNRTIHG